MKSKFFQYTNKGFTLIELMIAVSIIVILLSAGTVSFSQLRKSARDNKRMADFAQLKSALEVYRGDQSNPTYPVANANGEPTNLAPTWIPSFPADPVNGFKYRYVRVNNNSYRLCARVEAMPTTNPTTMNAACRTDDGCGASLAACNYEETSP
jgi:prepilin-type N-terminal cleavage/methylation domain-containing protein